MMSNTLSNTLFIFPLFHVKLDESENEKGVGVQHENSLSVHKRRRERTERVYYPSYANLHLLLILWLC